MVNIVTWNVNGLRSMLKKNKDGKINNEFTSDNTIMTYFIEQNPDIVCLQEIKCNYDTILPTDVSFEKYGFTFNTINCSEVRKGYSGVAIYSKIQPINIIYNFGNMFDMDSELKDIYSSNIKDLTKEGRMITYEFDDYFVINVYTPNSKQDLSRLNFRVNVWDNLFKQYVNKIGKAKSVIICGDMNVAHMDIDVHNPKTVKGSHGFTLEEKNAFSDILHFNSLIDSFRFLFPEKQKFSWFSPRIKNKKCGWRIDYILISSCLKNNLKKCDILDEYKGSDHLPYFIHIDI